MIYVHGEDVSNLNPEEVNHERNKSRENLDRLPPGPFEKNTIRAYQFIADQLCLNFKDFEVDQISPDEVLAFLNKLTEASRPYTKRIRYSQLSSFFNFVKNNIESDGPNP